jgi:hypothetical protein
MCAVRLLFQIAMIAIRFIKVLAGLVGTAGIFFTPVSFLELFVAHIAIGIKTGLAFPG